MSDLIQDIYKVVKEGVDIRKETAKEFGETLANIIAERLAPKTEKREFTLRMSNIGKGARQLYYDRVLGSEDTFSGPTKIKFLIGDITEALCLFLAEISGHKVTHKQAEVTLDGIKGHIDADIDGVTVDVKSASPHAFKKFKDGSLVDNDSFGYIEQISGYSKARDTDGAFLALEKVSGELAYLPLSKEELSVFNVSETIKYKKKAVFQDEEPDRCHDPEPEGASGNLALGVNCSYCPHFKHCWRDANGGIGPRGFRYSNGIKWLVKVVKEPKVPELALW